MVETAESPDSIELTVDVSKPLSQPVTPTSVKLSIKTQDEAIRKQDSIQLDKADLRFTRAQRTRRIVVSLMWLASLVTVVGNLVVGIEVRDLVHEQMPAVMGASFDFVELGLARMEQIGVAFTTIFDPSLLSQQAQRYGYPQYANAGTIPEGQSFWHVLEVSVREQAESIIKNKLAVATSAEFIRTYVPFLERQMPWEHEGMEMARAADGNDTELIEAQHYMTFPIPEKNNNMYFNSTVLSTSLIRVQDANENDLQRLDRESIETRDKAVKWGIAGVVVLGAALVAAFLTTHLVNREQLRLKQAIRATRKRLRRRIALDEMKIVASPHSANSSEAGDMLHADVLLADADDDEDEDMDSRSSDAGSSSDMGESTLSGSTRLTGSTNSSTDYQLGTNSMPTSGTGTSRSRSSRSSADWRRLAQRTLQRKERIVSGSLLLCWLLLLTSTLLFWTKAERAEEDVQTAGIQVLVAIRAYKVYTNVETAWSAVMLSVASKDPAVRGVYSAMVGATMSQFARAWAQVEEYSHPPQETIDTVDNYYSMLEDIMEMTSPSGNSSAVDDARDLFNGPLQVMQGDILDYVIPLRDGIVRDIDQLTEDVQDSINTALGIAIAALVVGLVAIVFAAAAENKRVAALQLHWTARTWSLERVIDNSELRSLLHKQAEEVYSGENIAFLATYRMAARNGLTDVHLVELYRRFLHNNSSEMLNVSDHLRSMVADLFKGELAEDGTSEAGAIVRRKSDATVRKRRLRALAMVHVEVTRLVSTNLLQNFLESPQFSAWRREHRARAETEIKLLQKRADMGA